MSAQLLPCPFCGGESRAVVETEEFARIMFAGHCQDVMCSARGSWEASRPEAIAAWNRRATPQPEPREGWVLVPREPTEEQVAAAVKVLRLPWREIQRMMEAYRAMIAAAPAVPTPQRQDGEVD